jgi:hypothetical protein
LVLCHSHRERPIFGKVCGTRGRVGIAIFIVEANAHSIPWGLSRGRWNTAENSTLVILLYLKVISSRIDTKTLRLQRLMWRSTLRLLYDSSVRDRFYRDRLYEVLLRESLHRACSRLIFFAAFRRSCDLETVDQRWSSHIASPVRLDIQLTNLLHKAGILKAYLLR